MVDLKATIRTIPDHPKPGIMFRDVTTMLGNAEAFAAAVNRLCDQAADHAVDAIVGIEARGFILGAPVAYKLGLGFVPVRKKGKLPGDTISHDYTLEYGTDTLEVHTDALMRGQSVMLVDDLLATGGTAEAAWHLMGKIGADVKLASFVVDLPDLGGRRKLEALGMPVATLVEFEGD